MENQKADGSWGLNSSHPSLVKDSLSSTLACVLALQKWNVGEHLVRKAEHNITTLGCSQPNEGLESMTFYRISYSIESSRVYKLATRLRRTE
ncbi:hypothetical protein LguiA_021897 [Lonicera macranthoides]